MPTYAKNALLRRLMLGFWISLAVPRQPLIRLKGTWRLSSFNDSATHNKGKG